VEWASGLSSRATTPSTVAYSLTCAAASLAGITVAVWAWVLGRAALHLQPVWESYGVTGRHAVPARPLKLCLK